MNLSKINRHTLKITDLFPFLIFIVGTGFLIGYEFVLSSPEKGLLNTALYMTFIVAIFFLCIEKDNAKCLSKRLIEAEAISKAERERAIKLDNLTAQINKLKLFINTTANFHELSPSEQSAYLAAKASLFCLLIKRSSIKAVH